MEPRGLTISVSNRPERQITVNNLSKACNDFTTTLHSSKSLRTKMTDKIIEILSAKQTFSAVPTNNRKTQIVLNNTHVYPTIFEKHPRCFYAREIDPRFKKIPIKTDSKTLHSFESLLWSSAVKQSLEKSVLQTWHYENVCAERHQAFLN